MNHTKKVISALKAVNKKLKKMHICRVGVMEDYITTIEESLIEAERIENFQKQPRNIEVFKIKESLTVKQILDNRRGYLQRFKYCPDCGIKIDWKSLTEGI